MPPLNAKEEDMLRRTEYILGIDPGNTESAYCLCDITLEPLRFDKVKNFEPCDSIVSGQRDMFLNEIWMALGKEDARNDNTIVVIENIESFGMPVGRSVLDTCIYIGELKRTFDIRGYPVRFIYRHEEKMAICHSSKANDATIKQALVDRFAPGEKNHGKGTKDRKGFFYGFKADVWSSFAIATTYHDIYMERGC